MTALNNATLASLPAQIGKPAYDRGMVRAGIAHFSLGNFHRAHQAVYVDQCLAQAGQQGWGIVGIGLMDDARERAKAAIMPQQDGLYTLTEYAPGGDVAVKVIGSIVEYLHAPADPEAVLRRLCDPAIRIVSMTVTEGGYNLDDATGQFRLDHPAVAQDLANPARPATVFGFVAEALARRRAAGVGPFTVMSCDNLRHNGNVAATAFLSFARARDPQLADWMAAEVSFPNSMVDRITPATTDQDAARLNAANGIDDGLPVFAESFTQWVIEDRFVAGRPALETVGAQMTDDVSGYEYVKLRMLNASHSMLCFAGLLAGYRLAHETMQDPDFHALLDQFMQRDAAPLLQAPSDVNLDEYRRMVLARFGNPAIGDQLLRIASDGASKIPVFVQDTLRMALEQKRDTRRLAFLMAAFARYLGGKDDKGAEFPVVEPRLSQADLAAAAAPDLAPLSITPFQSWKLGDYPEFANQFRAFRTAIARQGVKATLHELIGKAEASHQAA